MSHAATRRQSYSRRDHQVAERRLPTVYRCTACGELSFGPVRPDSLFGLCKAEHLHRTFRVATDREALRWAAMRAPQPTPFYPTGTEW